MKDEKVLDETTVDVEEVEQENVEEPSEELEPEITIEELITKLAELKKKAYEEKQRADEMTKVAITLRADFDNYRKRTREESFKDKERGNIEVIEKVIPVLDVVEQAISMISDENVKKGVEMIQNQIVSLLASFKVTEIEAKGKDFDPKFHEAIMQIDGQENESGKISDVFQKGYKIVDRVIRPARVIVIK